MKKINYPLSSRRENGIALFVVMIFVMLSMLLALWASRSALFSEMIVGNDADYQRAFEAAQTLLQDAELDIQGKGADGKECTGDTCRLKQNENHPDNVKPFPIQGDESKELIAWLAAQEEGCKGGMCSKRLNEQDFWNSPNFSTKIAKNGIGARYGDYSGAKYDNNSNPILRERSGSESGGWYWIEVMCHTPQCDDTNSGSIGGNTAENGPAALITNTPSIQNTGNPLGLNLSPNVVYRITAVAYGLRSGTRVVLQQLYAPSRALGD